MCCVSTAYDVKDVEAHAFLSTFEGQILEAMNHPTDLMSARGSVASGAEYNTLSQSSQEMNIP